MNVLPIMLKTETSESPCGIAAQTVKDFKVKCNENESKVPKFAEPFYSNTVGGK